MSSTPRITLEQWRALQAVVEAGGYAQAAEALHKSQSTVTYAVQQIQKLLDVKVFEIHGRKAVLTEAGKVLYRRARTLLEEAAALERGAAEMAQEWQPEIRLAVEIVFPTWLLLDCLAVFAQERPETRIEVYETVLTGTEEMLSEGRVDIAIGSLQGGVTGTPLLPMRFIAVAHPDHPLHHLGRKITQRDMKRHRRIFVRDTSTQRKSDSRGAELRWTVSNKATSIHAVVMGLGFAWLPEETILPEIRAGLLKALPLKEGAVLTAPLYLAFSDPEFPGRDAARLAEIIRTSTASACPKAKARGAYRAESNAWLPQIEKTPTSS
jgi:DNA-binding transcriptional LysR family regulator